MFVEELNNMKKIIISIVSIIILILIIFVGIFFSKKYIFQEQKAKDVRISKDIMKSEKNEEIKNVEEQEDSIVVVLEEKEDIRVSMSVIGDIMCHNSQYNDAYKNGKYDFSYVFEDIKQYIENSDISIGNLETTFAGKTKGYSSYPNFNTPENLAQDLKELGVDVLSTANNHSLDTGYNGIESTIDYLDEVGISHIGTYKSEDAQNKILIQDVNGMKIAFLAYTYGTNGIAIPNGKEYCINLIDKKLISKHLEIAKKQKPDVICVNMHWGEEYQITPNNEQKELADFLFENGVDIILGSHPHVLQEMENKTIVLPDGNEKNGFVIYSLGNFMSGQDKENTRNSIILMFDIVKSGRTEKISIENISYIPIYTFTYPKYKNYRLLNMENTINLYENGEDKTIGENYYNLLKKELQHVKTIIDSD